MFQVSRFEYGYDENIKPVKPMTGIERLASRLAQKLNSEERLTLRQWSDIVKSSHVPTLLKASILTRKAYARVVAVYYRHDALTGTLAGARIYDGVIEGYHKRGLGVCQVHDDMAVLVTKILS